MKGMTGIIKELKEKAGYHLVNETNMKDILSTVLECFDNINSVLNQKFDEGVMDNDSVDKQTNFVSTTNSLLKVNTASANIGGQEKINYDKERNLIKKANDALKTL